MKRLLVAILTLGVMAATLAVRAETAKEPEKPLPSVFDPAAMFYFSSTPDYTDAAMMIAEAYQDGFALPDRDYYLTDDYKSERAEYRHHLERIFRLLGDDTKKAKAAADATLRIETALAKAAMSLVDRREPKNIHHKTTLAEFVKLAPSFDSATYLAEIGAPQFVSLDVADPGFFKGPGSVAEVLLA